MAKILKPYTIIPSDLYVSRDADHQIESIIEDMGRPGYVLVSRQMGKTNLLLNVKRNLESIEDIFIYIDLSNPFESAKACFENIVDSILETNEDRLKLASSNIYQRRKELLDTPAHKQHTNELRLILKEIKGKLVIILDEIDALTKTQYSDQIFAQIRSTYFSRVNYPEFERLTYILSGVVEPTEIIKDPKISPFNIGQKIFLNDFSKKEFLSLLNQSKLHLSLENQERIYYWTSGNPRMTWDVCSEVESYIQSNNTIDSFEIDKIVNDIYLTSYDKPPIDNIRELVKNDREIRNAIIEMIYNNGDKISDKIKNKLYLSGVANYSENTVAIKNEIIKRALSIDWVRAVEEEEKGLIMIAVETYAAQDYKNALVYFLKFLKDNSFEESSDKPHYYYMIGFSLYKNSDFKEAVPYLNLAEFDLDDEPKSYFDTIFLKALCYTYLDLHDQALEGYKTILESGRRDEIYLKSLINYGAVSLKSKKPELVDESVEIFHKIINDNGASNPKIKEAKAKEVKSIAYYNLATIASTNNDSPLAEKYFNNAVEFSNTSSKPLMTLGLINITENPDKRRSLVLELIHTIASKELIPRKFDPEEPLQFSLNELNEITIICFTEFREEFDSIIPTVELYSKKTIAQVLYELAIDAINKHEWGTCQKLFDSLTKEFDNPLFVFEKIKYDIVKFSAYFNNHIADYLLFAKTFIEEIRTLDVLTIENFANLILILSNEERNQEALNYINLLNDYRDPKSEKFILDFLVIDHLELNIYKQTGNREICIRKAANIITLTQDPAIKTHKSNLISDTGLDFIKTNAEKVMQVYNVREPIRTTQKFGRNEIIKVRYQDGTIIQTKYKKVEEDIRKGDCLVLMD